MNFSCNMNQSFANETQIDNFDWIVQNLIVHKLLINYLSLIKESIQKEQQLTTVL